MTIDGRRRTITKRETIATRMVDKSASADPRATKMLIDTMKGVEQRAGEPGGSGEAAAAKPLRVSTVPRRAAWHADRESDNLFYRKITPLQSGTGAAFTTRVAFLSEQVADATNRFSWQRNSGPKSDVVQVFRHNSLR